MGENEQIEIVDKIIVPYGYGEKYKASPQWKELAEFIEEAPKPKWTLAKRIRFALCRIINKIRASFTKQTTTNYEDLDDWED